MDYRKRKYYLIKIYNYWNFNGIIKLFDHVPSRKIRIYNPPKIYKYTHYFVLIMISYKFEEDKKFKETMNYILEKMPNRVKFIELSKELLGQ